MTFLVWTILCLLEASHGAWASEYFFAQFILAWIYLLIATMYIPPYETREIHNKYFGGKFFTLTSGLYFIPLIMWWGAVYKPVKEKLKKENPHFHLDTRDLQESLDIFLRKKIERVRNLNGFWGAVEDFSRQYFGDKNLKDIWWIFLLTGFLSINLANYSIWLNKKFVPKYFDKNIQDNHIEKNMKIKNYQEYQEQNPSETDTITVPAAVYTPEKKSPKVSNSNAYNKDKNYLYYKKKKKGESDETFYYSLKSEGLSDEEIKAHWDFLIPLIEGKKEKSDLDYINEIRGK